MIHVAGAGLAGLTIARALADAGRVVHVYEATSEIGGACREAQPGVPLHGPHTFHTSNPRIFDWLKRFAVWQSVTRSARSHDLQTQLPIDRRYLVDFLGLHGFLRLSEALDNPLSVRLATLERSGDPVAVQLAQHLYERVVRGYSQKQWGHHWDDPAMQSVLNRLPVWFINDVPYHGRDLQLVPADGYNAFFDRLVDHPNIKVHLGQALEAPTAMAWATDQHVIWTGPLDELHDFRLGPLPYRTMSWHSLDMPELYGKWSQTNYSDHPTITRRNLYPTPEGLIYQEETPGEWTEGAYRHYPIPAGPPQGLADQYRKLDRPPTLHLLGRLAEYRYLDMDDVVAKALRLSRVILAHG